MRISLTLHTDESRPLIPINYQYPVSSAVYKILKNADEGYSLFLHERGYGKGFKMFTFSDLHIPFKIIDNALLLLSPKAELIICFHIPRAAETFIRGLFMNQQFVIADRKNKARFTVQNVEVLNDPFEEFKEEEIIKAVLKPLSPIVCGIKNEKGNYDFLSPQDERYEEMLWLNWQEKLRSVYEKPEADYLMHPAFVKVNFFQNPPKSRLITIKAENPEETKIRGFNNFLIEVIGQKVAIEMLLNAGVGIYNAQGMGCVEVVEY